MPYFSQIIGEMIPEIHTMEKYDFFKPITVKGRPCGSVAQLAECLPLGRKVPSSILGRGMEFFFKSP